MAVRAFWVDLDGEGEPTVWTGQPESPRAVLRRCEISGDDAVKDAVMKRLNDVAVSAKPESSTTWRCIANTCGERVPFSGWDDGQRQIKAHARQVAHDPRWPLTLTFHDATGRQYAVDYAEATQGQS